MSALETTIDNALCKLRIDQTSGRLSVLYQPRNASGEVAWVHWYRDPFYEGATFDAVWAATEAAAAVTVHSQCPHQPSPIYPDFSADAIGWSPLQKEKAISWAIEAEAEHVRQLALKFIPSACLVQQQQAAE